MKPIAYRNRTLRKWEPIKENPPNVYRFLKMFSLTADLAFEKSCDSKAADELIRLAEKVLFPDVEPRVIRMKLARRWATLKQRRGDYNP